MADHDQDKFKSEAVLRYEVQNFSLVTDVRRGPVCYVRGLPWQIRFEPELGPDGKKYLVIGLQCSVPDGTRNWSCNVRFILRLISQKVGVPDDERELNQLFDATTTVWESPLFKLWNKVCDPAKGYIKNGVVILEISMSADVPVGINQKTSQFLQKIRDLKANNGTGIISSRSVFPLVIDPAGAKESLSDVSLECQSKRSFNCHRIILAQNSTTFKTMFTSDFAEGNMKPVVIDDISPDTMLEVLRFIYCGYVETDLTAASREVQYEFLYAAEKYGLKSLLDLIIMALDETLDASTACRYLFFADRFNLASLKKSCFAVMAKPDNRLAVFNSPNWAEFAGNKQLVGECYCFEAKP